MKPGISGEHSSGKNRITSAEFPHVIICNENTANDAWLLVRRQIMSISPELIFRNHHWPHAKAKPSNNKMTVSG